MKSYPKSKLRSDALYSLGVAREELDQFAEAGEAYDLFLADYQKHDLVNEVRMRKAETVLRGGKFQEAAIHYQEQGDLSSATRCLNLALANKGDTTINIEQVGNRVIQDSVIMSDD